MIRRRRVPVGLLLALPGVLLLHRWAIGDALAMDLLHPTGELSVRLMLLAMLPGPLIDFFAPNRFLLGWLALRRNFGVAAFAYAVLHLAFYALDMASLAAMLDELTLPAIWTGWLALLLMAGPASISFDRAMRRLGRTWKRIQQLAYAAFVVTLVHWVLLDWHWQPAAIHLAPLIIAWSLRLVKRRRLHVRRSAL